MQIEDRVALETREELARRGHAIETVGDYSYLVGGGQSVMIDPESGQPVMGSFMDYGMPRSDDFPALNTEIVEVLSPTNPLGIKAGGEGGTTPAPSVVIGAIVDALKGYGIDNLTMPATPQSVWQAIQAAKANHKED